MQPQLAERVRLQMQLIVFLVDRADLKHLWCSGNRVPNQDLRERPKR